MKRRPPHADALLERMEDLLRQWRPENLAAEGQLEIPLLTDTVKGAAQGLGGERPPVPSGVTRELLQAHLAVAAEEVMQSLYHELAADLNEHLHERLRHTIDGAVDQALQHAMNALRRQILVRVADALTESIETLGHAETHRPD